MSASRLTPAAVWRALLLAAPIRLWAMMLAGPPLTLFAGWLVWLVRYGWPAERAEQQLQILGVALWAALALIAVIVVSLAAVKVKAEAGLARLELDADDGG